MNVRSTTCFLTYKAPCACGCVHEYFHVCWCAQAVRVSVKIWNMWPILFSTWSCSSLINSCRDSYMSRGSPPPLRSKTSSGCFPPPAHITHLLAISGHTVHRKKKTTMRISGPGQTHAIIIQFFSSTLVCIYSINCIHFKGNVRITISLPKLLLCLCKWPNVCIERSNHHLLQLKCITYGSFNKLRINMF